MAFPLDDRSALEIFNTPRPQLTKPQNRYRYFPDTAVVPGLQAVNTRNRSFSIGARVDIPAPGAQGVLFAYGFVGPIASFILFGLLAVQQTAYGQIIGFGIFAIALRLSIDQLVGPLVLGKAAEIPALVVIFAFLVGGTLYGLLGVILAIPTAAAIKIVLANIYGDAEDASPAIEQPGG